MSRTRLISEDEVTEFQNWSAPDVDSDTNGFSGLLTAERIEEIQKEAYDEAYQKGKKEGFEQAYQQAQIRFNEQASRIDSILNVLSDPINEFDNQLEESLIDLALIIARQLIRRELKTEPGEIIAVVREAMDALPMNQQMVKIYLHCDDAKLVREVLMLDTDNSRWQLNEEPTLARGDCRIETGDSRIDATVESRLTAIASKLLGGQRTSDEADVAKGERS